ncbi:hypothetical protein Celaphus_00015033 [Cervus elaphus hippelaphus]|uniref:Protein Wnt n=1 Tax=Cervus elaphus hippelaphus TaxID=46360 RepID=A0A212D3W6_CEREH|nr:hypothetical protein Celaphus_00015033 [Cervus elaphus hippelaphus]
MQVAEEEWMAVWRRHVTAPGCGLGAAGLPPLPQALRVTTMVCCSLLPRAVGSPLVMDPTSICRKARRLAGRQAELCQAEPEVVAELARGARLGVRECQFQFRFRRWNCSSHSKAFGRILQQDIRETAFVFAITAAGASHAVTQACSMGELLHLPFTTLPYLIFRLSSGPFCAPPPGSVPIRLLFCSPQAVRSHTRTECKCHGLSGSCALRTCWQKLPPFREVGARLLERFHGASRVMGTNDGKALLPAVRTLKPPGRADLLYAADSPDFCAPNRRTGSPGTRGRACNSSAPDLSGCDLLCCGRGHRQESVLLEENCLCRFHWCCVVQCHRCRVRKELSLCL